MMTIINAIQLISTGLERDCMQYKRFLPDASCLGGALQNRLGVQPAQEHFQRQRRVLEVVP